MINTLPGNNRTGYCYDKLKRFRQQDAAENYIFILFSTLFARRCHIRSIFLPALCIMRRKFPICISILSSSFHLTALLTLQRFFNQRTVFYNAKTSHPLWFYTKLIITIPAIILACANSAYCGAFAIRTTNQRNHTFLSYVVRKNVKYTNTICLSEHCVFILRQYYSFRKDLVLYILTCRICTEPHRIKQQFKETELSICI